MDHHVHGYRWIGHGTQLGDIGKRRPEHPEFTSDDRPPVLTHYWLRKPAQLIQDTWHSPAEAVGWMWIQWQDSGAADSDQIPESNRRRNGERWLRLGDDVVWSAWLTGGRFISLSTISCPHRGIHGPALPCPLRRQAHSRDTRPQ